MQTETTTSRDEAIAAVNALHAEGQAATLYSHAGRYVALDLDAPIVDVTDALFDLGLDTERAEDEALRLVARGY